MNDVRGIEVALGGSPGFEVSSRTCAAGCCPATPDRRLDAWGPIGAAPRARRRCPCGWSGRRALRRGSPRGSRGIRRCRPAGERAHVPAHLSPEVASLLSSAPAWSPRRHPNVSELADAIAGQMGGIAGDTAEQVAAGVLASCDRWFRRSAATSPLSCPGICEPCALAHACLTFLAAGRGCPAGMHDHHIDLSGNRRPCVDRVGEPDGRHDGQGDAPSDPAVRR